MSASENSTRTPIIQPTGKKGPRVLATIFIVGMSLFIAAAIWVNWPKHRIPPEPLSPELASIIRDMPGSSDAMIYVGLKDIRDSRFWKEAVPDSLKETKLFSMGDRVEALMKKNGINLSEDLDTLLVSFQRSGRKEQKFIGMAWGAVASKASPALLKAVSLETAEIGGRRAYALDSTLWICPMGEGKMAVASSRSVLEGFLVPTGNLLQRDQVTAAMIGKAVYKSHLWFALPSPTWTSGMLQSLTSVNRDVKSVGNLNRLEHLALSVKFGEGLKGESEWIYSDRQSAFFASTFLWATVRLAGAPGTRTSEAAKNLLNHLKVQQNLQSVVITTDLPMSSFRKK